MVKYIFLFFLSLCFNHLIIADHSVVFKGHPLNTPVSIIQQENIDFISVFELKKILNLSISKSYKFNGYSFSMKSKELLISAKTNEVWLNGTRHFFCKKPFFKDSLLYVPFDDFLLLLGLSRSYSDSTSSISFKPIASKFQTINPFVSFEKKLPFHLVKTISSTDNLVYKNHKINLSKYIHSFNNIAYFNPEYLFNKFNYKLTKTDKGLSITYNNFTYSFNFNSRIWRGSYKETSWSFLAEAPLLDRNNAFYFPINSLFAFLDYSLSYNSIASSYELLDNIHSVSFYNMPSKQGLNLISRHKLSYSLDISQHNPFLQILIIPFSKSFTTESASSFLSQQIESLKLTNKYFTFEQLHSSHNANSKNNTKLSIFTKSSISFFPQPSTSGLFLSMKKMLSSVNISKSGSLYTIKLSGKNIISPKIYKEKKMLIFDFNDTVNSLTQLKKVNGHNFRSFRSSQLSITPLTSRFVLDFNHHVPSYKLVKTSDSLTVTFKAIQPKIAPKKIASSQKKKKPKIYKTRTKGLRNKVIILDPGHGGVDPGAVVNRTLYEKKYTLDIAKRVQKLLEKEGAYVILTRTSDSTRSLQSRVRLANRQNADLFLSIHFNSFKNSRISGSQSFYSKSKDKKLATHLQKQITHDFKTKNLGVSRSRFFVLRHTKMPSVLLEPMFMTNKKERKQLLTTSYRSKLANSIFQGVKNYYKDS